MYQTRLTNLLRGLFPARWFPEPEPTSAETEVLRTTRQRVGRFDDTAVDLTLTFYDRRHDTHFYVEIRDGEVWMGVL